MLHKKNIFQQIKDASDIVSEISVFIDLKKKGRNYWGICPFHEDTSPSMSVSPEKQMFKCFVCQVGGGVVNFVSKYQNISIVEAAKILAEKAGIPFVSNSKFEKKYSDKDQKLFSVLAEAMNFFQYSLSIEGNSKANEYLKKRGITQKEIEKFSIGYAPAIGLVKFLKTKGHDDYSMINASLATERMTDFFRDRIIFGIKNNEGKIVGFSARSINDKEDSKYINSSETKLFNKKEILYNYSIAKDVIGRDKEIIITEGFMDVIALSKADIFNSVAIMGTALTPEHTRLLRNKIVVLMLDSDKAGISATIKSIKTLLPVNKDVYVVENSSGLDPDEILNKEGKVELQKTTQKRVHALEFVFEQHMKKFGNSSPDKVDAFVKSFVKYLIGVDTTYKDFYITKMVQTLGVSKETISMLIKPIEIRSEMNYDEVDNEISEQYVDDSVLKIESQTQIKENKSARYLLSAMLNKPSLIPIYEKAHVNFADPMMQVMGGYIVKLKNGIVPDANEATIDELKGLKAYAEGNVDLEEAEFRNLIELVNISHRKQTINKFKKKINDEKSTQKDKIKILEEMGRLVKGRKE